MFRENQKKHLRLGLTALIPILLGGSIFNPHKIISDSDLTDYTRMSLVGIQSFLERQGGVLVDYITEDIDGIERTAGEIIYQASQTYHLNAQFLIATIQKESSLITGNNEHLIDWAMGYAVCDGCSKSNPNVVKYKGFAKQLDAAADTIRNFYLADLEENNSTVSGWGVGVTKTTLDGVEITPQNDATAVLYTYTPWLGYYGGDASIGGNSLFYDVMEDFFPNRAVSILDYPNLTLFQDTQDGSVFKLEHGFLRPITSLTALLANYNANEIIAVDTSVIERYEQGDPITFPKFILVQAPSGGIYLIDQEHKRRAITSAAVFKSLGYNPEEVLPITAEELEDVAENPPLTEKDKYPLGALLQDNTTGAVSYLDTEKKLHPIWSKEIIENRFKGYALYQEPPSLFKTYESTEPVKFKDGTLLKIPERDTIYIIDEGKKRPILSGEVLEQLGGYSRVVTTSKAMLKMHIKGTSMRITKLKE